MNIKRALSSQLYCNLSLTKVINKSSLILYLKRILSVSLQDNPLRTLGPHHIHHRLDIHLQQDNHRATHQRAVLRATHHLQVRRATPHSLQVTLPILPLLSTARSTIQHIHQPILMHHTKHQPIANHRTKHHFYWSSFLIRECVIATTCTMPN